MARLLEGDEAVDSPGKTPGRPGSPPPLHTPPEKQAIPMPAIFA